MVNINFKIIHILLLINTNFHCILLLGYDPFSMMLIGPPPPPPPGQFIHPVDFYPPAPPSVSGVPCFPQITPSTSVNNQNDSTTSNSSKRCSTDSQVWFHCLYFLKPTNEKKNIFYILPCFDILKSLLARQSKWFSLKYNLFSFFFEES